MAIEDIIYGKNRHLFGGIEPSNMIKFEASVDEEHDNVFIDVILPTDTIIDGQTLCTVEGAVIRRRDDNYPVDEFDGDLVATVKSMSPVRVTDSNTVLGGTYFYSAFPYTKQGVYNRNPANRTVVNEPKPMETFSISYTNNGAPVITIKAELPEGVKGAVIRRSTNGYPVDENDGDLIADISADDTVTDTDLEYGFTYYYAAFTYTETGVYNRSLENSTGVITTFQYTYLYGYDLDTTDSNPSTRVTYPSGVDNETFESAKLDDDDSKLMLYGDWPSEAGEKFMPRPCVVVNGEVAEYLDPNDYTKNIDGTDATRDGVGYNTMMEWPKIWTKRWEEDGIYHFRCSDGPVDSDYECWCNYDKNNNRIEHFYTSAYPVYADHTNAIAYSCPGQLPSSLAYEYAPSFAKKNGDGFDVLALADWLLIQDLVVMITKSTDSQSLLGAGRNSTRKVNGYVDAYGLFGLYVGTGPKIFGMESLWGDIPRYVSGLFANGNYYYIKITKGTKDGSTATDYSSDMSPVGYLTIESDLNFTMSSYSYGGISDFETFSFGRLPKAVDGSTTTFECDYFDASDAGNISKNYAVACVGGAGSITASEHRRAGLFAMKFDDNGGTGYQFFISYKPTLKEV